MHPKPTIVDLLSTIALMQGNVGRLKTIGAVLNDLVHQQSAGTKWIDNESARLAAKQLGVEIAEPDYPSKLKQAEAILEREYGGAWEYQEPRNMAPELESA